MRRLARCTGQTREGRVLRRPASRALTSSHRARRGVQQSRRKQSSRPRCASAVRGGMQAVDARPTHRPRACGVAFAGTRLAGLGCTAACASARPPDDGVPCAPRHDMRSPVARRREMRADRAPEIAGAESDAPSSSPAALGAGQHRSVSKSVCTQETGLQRQASTQRRGRVCRASASIAHVRRRARADSLSDCSSARPSSHLRHPLCRLALLSIVSSKYVCCSWLGHNDALNWVHACARPDRILQRDTQSNGSDLWRHAATRHGKRMSA